MTEPPLSTSVQHAAEDAMRVLSAPDLLPHPANHPVWLFASGNWYDIPHKCDKLRQLFGEYNVERLILAGGIGRFSTPTAKALGGEAYEALQYLQAPPPSSSQSSVQHPAPASPPFASSPPMFSAAAPQYSRSAPAPAAGRVSVAPAFPPPGCQVVTYVQAAHTGGNVDFLMLQLQAWVSQQQQQQVQQQHVAAPLKEVVQQQQQGQQQGQKEAVQLVGAGQEEPQQHGQQQQQLLQQQPQQEVAGQQAVHHACSSRRLLHVVVVEESYLVRRVRATILGRLAALQPHVQSAVRMYVVPAASRTFHQLVECHKGHTLAALHLVWGELDRLFAYSTPASGGGLGLFDTRDAFMAVHSSGSHQAQSSVGSGAGTGTGTGTGSCVSGRINCGGHASYGEGAEGAVRAACAELMRVLGVGHDQGEAKRLLGENAGAFFMPGPKERISTAILQ